MKKSIVLLALTLVLPSTTWAWGRRGHQVVGDTASYLAAETQGGDGVRAHSFDMGYYCNVPDLIWKRPATYDMEKPQHFMDMEIFEREFAKKPEIKKPFELSRKDFDAAFPDIKQDAGRAFWRIRELIDQLDKVAADLRALEEPKGKARQDLQQKWIVLAGVLGHYIGDLSMPLHVSENYDGMKTGQKGIHSFFEDACVDQLFPQLETKVSELAKKEWPAFKKKNEKRPVLDMLVELSNGSKHEIDQLFAIDKKNSRDDVKKTCPKFEQMIVKRMAQSSMVLGEVYRRELGWKFDNEKFFFFAGEPEYIKPGVPDMTVVTKR